MIDFYGADKKTKRLVRKVYRTAFRYLRQKDIFLTELNIVDEGEIRRINREARGKDEVTDVLSFPAIEIKELPLSEKKLREFDCLRGRLILGEVVICMQRAAEQAAEYGHGERRETAYLALHGLLHLLGFDHMDEGDKEVMRGHEEAVLNKLKITRG